MEFPESLFTEGDETGVMDSLLEALQSGAAFRNRRKRTPKLKGEFFSYFMLLSREEQFLSLILLKSFVTRTVLWAEIVPNFPKFA